MPVLSWRLFLPHALLWMLILGVTLLLGRILWPLAPVLLLATSLAAMVEPVLFRPLDALAGHWWPRGDPALRTWLVAALATTLLGAIFAVSGLMMLWALLGSVTATLDVVIGIAMQDQTRIGATADLVSRQIVDVARMYGGQRLAAPPIAAYIQDLLTHTRVSTEVLSFLVAGTGGLAARAALVLVTLFYLLSQGHSLVAWIVRWLPLDDAAIHQVAQTYRTVAYHLLAHILGRALVLGAGLGVIAWAVAGLNGILVGLVATSFGLLPLVGPLAAWLPLAGLVWSRGDPLTAMALGLAGLLWSWLVERSSRRVANHLGTDQLWLEFLVFLGLIGGLLAYGPGGLVIGPAAVLGAAVAVTTVRLVYTPETKV